MKARTSFCSGTSQSPGRRSADGIISATGRSVTEAAAAGSSPGATLLEAIQTSAAINPETAAARSSIWSATSSACLHRPRSSRREVAVGLPHDRLPGHRVGTTSSKLTL